VTQKEERILEEKKSTRRKEDRKKCLKKNFRTLLAETVEMTYTVLLSKIKSMRGDPLYNE
jgi:hypothetical protein